MVHQKQKGCVVFIVCHHCDGSPETNRVCCHHHPPQELPEDPCIFSPFGFCLTPTEPLLLMLHHRGVGPTRSTRVCKFCLRAKHNNATQESDHLKAPPLRRWHLPPPPMAHICFHPTEWFFFTAVGPQDNSCLHLVVFESQV